MSENEGSLPQASKRDVGGTSGKGPAEGPARLAARLGAGKGWQETPVGFCFRTFRRTVTETDLVNFVTLAGFNEGLFMDATLFHEEDGASAAETDAESIPYEKRFVPGALTYAFAEGLVIQTGMLQGMGIAFLGMELTAREPVYVGDTIEVEVEVVQSRPTRHPDRGVVVTRNTVRNQRGQVVLEYRPARLVRSAKDRPGVSL